MWFDQVIPEPIAKCMDKMAKSLPISEILLVRANGCTDYPYSTSCPVKVLDRDVLTETALISACCEEAWWKEYISRGHNYWSDFIRFYLATQTPSMFYADADIYPEATFNPAINKTQVSFGLWGAGQDINIFSVNQQCSFFRQLIFNLEQRRVSLPHHWISQHYIKVRTKRITGFTEITKGITVK